MLNYSIKRITKFKLMLINPSCGRNKKIICFHLENVKKYYVFDKFLINLTNILGYSFVSDRCSSCNATLKMAYFDLNKGCLVCPKCKTDSAIKISENCLKDLIYLFKCDYIDLKSENFIKSEKEILKVLALNLEWRVGLKILRINWCFYCLIDVSLKYLFSNILKFYIKIINKRYKNT